MMDSLQLSRCPCRRPFAGCLGSRSRVQVQTFARAGGRGSQRGDSGLILGPGGPGSRSGGQSSLPGPTPKLIIPGSQFKKPQPQGPTDLVLPSEDGTIAAPPVTTRYRPPAGFMDDMPQDYGMSSLDPEQGLNRLRNRAGHWHTLAKVIVTLYGKGFDSSTLDQLAAVQPIDQSRWIVAGTVYDSLKAEGGLTEAELQHFDRDGDRLLVAFRYLGVDRRVAAAKYIMANNLSATECEVLARAMKEWERRPLERDGFDNGPADCLAFKYLRDAIECRDEEDRVAKIQQGLKVASTQGAKQRLLELQEAPEDQSDSMTMLTVCRMQAEELTFRPLPQVSRLGTATAAEIAATPRATQEGAFGSFSISEGAPNVKWVALPQWKALQDARRPVALPINNCMANPAIVAASRVKTDEDKRRMAGSGLLVVDATAPDTPDDGTFYLVAAPGDGVVQLVAGGQLKEGQKPVATVLFLARPPLRESVMSSTSEVLQV